MINRVDKVIVGKDINRTASVKINVAATADTLAEGEVVVLDKNKSLLAAGSTVADSDIIYLGVGTGTTWDDPNADERREVYYSFPIEGKNVVSYKGQSYTAATELVATVGAGLTPVVGTEYAIKLVFTDNPGYWNMSQYEETYRATAESVTLSDLYTLFRTKINNNKNSFVTASGAGTLILTADSDSSTISSIDNYYQHRFEVFLTSDNFGTSTVTYNTPVRPSGHWRQLRDLMKAAKGYDGITNPTHFPVPSAYSDFMALDYSTPETYDYIVIEHNNEYASPDNAYNKNAKMSTYIALPVDAGQTMNILAVLNPWMASTPKAFDTVTV